MGGIILAFKKYSFAKGIINSPWNGIKNFTFLFGSKWAKIMFRNTIGYNLVFLITGTVFAIFVAIILGEVSKKLAQQTYQTIILIPHLVSTVLIGYLVFAFLSSTNGFVNKGILEPLGFEGIEWYTEAKYWPFILVIVQLWRSFGLFYQVPQNSGLLYTTTTTIDTFVYRALMQAHDVGRSLAAGFLQSVLGFFVVMLTNFIVRKIEPDSALF